MKIQSLAVIFIIIILPISLVLATYTKTRVETISLQATYDSKLNDATYDALKAYQINSFKNDTSGLVNSKMRDIEASVNTFFNSMSINFGSLGYTKNTLQNYVPALVYTMYDGYYIYAPFTNTWDYETEDIVSKQKESYENEGKEYTEIYGNNNNIYGLKPYVYYSCRYKSNNYDIVITYSLDNYIQIQGIINDNPVNMNGYVLKKADSKDEMGVFYDGSTNRVYYNKQEITYENGLKEYVYVDGDIQEYQYIKKNGTKYYTDGINVFTVLNGKKVIQTQGVSVNEIKHNRNAFNYYKESYILMNYIKYNLNDLNTNDIVDFRTGKKYSDETIESPYYPVEKIFNGDVETEDSNFNTHRIDVIKNSIETNLSVAISNFNNYSGVSTNFQMPRLKDSDWDKIMDNISIISFFQGVNIGGKVYNGYSIITNTKNEDVVMEDSIYIKTADGTIHRRTEKGLTGQNAIGIFNVNIEPRDNGEDKYYLPITGTLSYDSIVTQNNVIDWSEVTDNDLLKIYYTALARERYGLYRPKINS